MLESTEPALHEPGGAHHACPDKARAGREPARTVTRRSRSAWIFHLSPKRGAQHCLGVQGLDLLSIGSEQLIQRFHCSAPATIQCNAGAAASSRPLGTARPALRAALLPRAAGMTAAGWPAQVPARRLETIEAAGRAAVPFTSGLLIGIGEGRRRRLADLRLLLDLHRRHGHLQARLVC